MMTVIDEANKSKKYEHLLFVEFLDMLCRMAIVAITMSDLIEYKVHLLLEILYGKYYEARYISRTDHPLRPVDETYKHD